MTDKLDDSSISEKAGSGIVEYTKENKLTIYNQFLKGTEKNEKLVIDY